MFEILPKALQYISKHLLRVSVVCLAFAPCVAGNSAAAKSAKSNKNDAKNNITDCRVAKIANLGNGKISNRRMLFAGGDSVSKFYRIPALAKTPGGTLVALADRRLESNADLPGPIDVVARSSFDGGRTWTAAVPVALHDAPGGGGYGDPAIGIDSITGDVICVMTHDEGLWTATQGGGSARICVNRSSDGGRTWSEPVDVTEALFSQEAGKAPVQCVTAFATSGRMLTQRDGTMWFVLVCRPESDNKWGPLSLYACRSKDGGHSWTALPVCVDANGDESKMAELADGTLLMSIRNRAAGHRKFARSTDGGATWTAPETSTTLPDPACNGDIIVISDGSLLHSIPDHNKERTRVSLYRSTDGAASWSKVAEICPVGSCYSSIVELAPGRIGVLSEEASSLGGLRLWYSEVEI